MVVLLEYNAPAWMWMGTRSSVQGMRYGDYTAQKLKTTDVNTGKSKHPHRTDSKLSPRKTRFKELMCDTSSTRMMHSTGYTLDTGHSIWECLTQGRKGCKALSPGLFPYSSLIMWISKLLGGCFCHIKVWFYSPKNSYFSHGRLLWSCLLEATALRLTLH